MNYTNRGFSLVEVLLSVSIFALLTLGFVGAILYGQESTALSGNRAKASFLAEEGLEAVRNIRDNQFTNLANGTYGLVISGNQWTLSGSSDTQGIFTRQIIIESVDSVRKRVTSTVTWQQNLQRAGSVSQVSYLTNWKASSGLSGMAGNLIISTSSAQLTGTTQLTGITLQNGGSSSIIIDKMVVTWTGGPSGNNIQGVSLNGNSVWSGNQQSGDLLDITNTSIATNITIPLTNITFKKDMTGTTVSIQFTLTDSTVATASGIKL